MDNDKRFGESREFTIYCNYGVLAAEKKKVYTYGREHSNGTCADKLTVKLPANDCFEIYETTSGGLAVGSSWGWQYDISEVLQGNENPSFYALDSDRIGHRIALEVLD